MILRTTLRTATVSLATGVRTASLQVSFSDGVGPGLKLTHLADINGPKSGKH